MAIERTFSIIKPDAVAKNVIGEIISRFEKNGLRIVAMKMLHLTRAQAEGFYSLRHADASEDDLVATWGGVALLLLQLDLNWYLGARFWKAKMPSRRTAS